MCVHTMMSMIWWWRCFTYIYIYITLCARWFHSLNSLVFLKQPTLYLNNVTNSVTSSYCNASSSIHIHNDGQETKSNTWQDSLFRIVTKIARLFPTIQRPNRYIQHYYDDITNKLKLWNKRASTCNHVHICTFVCRLRLKIYYT